jgi:hypothetical protein
MQSQQEFHVSVSNSAEEFRLHETISAPIKLLSSLFLSIRFYISIFRAYVCLIPWKLVCHRRVLAVLNSYF